METNTQAAQNIFGFNSELQKYIATVLPATSILIILTVAFTSNNPWMTTPLHILFPIIGGISMKLVSKSGEKIALSFLLSFWLPLLGIITYFAGIKSPCWIQVFPMITGVFLLTTSKPLHIIVVVSCLLSIAVSNYLIGMEAKQIMAIVLAVSVFAVIIERSFGYLVKQQAKIELQKKLIEKKNKDITDSINYAKRLQIAILPTENYWKKHLPENFILYRPKDIISGDFYWMENVDDNILFAAADCTGHGVPGAMISIVCSNALNRTVNEFKITEPAEILEKTRQLVLETFAKSESDIKDGMDISLCSLNTKTNELLWSGANNPLWHISGNNLNEIKGDKQPIGKTVNPKSFTTHKIELQKGDSFYVFTDGYADQFGGQDGRKLMKKKLKEILLQIQHKPITEQGGYLSDFIENWKAGADQVDDILIIGVQV